MIHLQENAFFLNPTSVEKSIMYGMSMVGNFCLQFFERSLPGSAKLEAKSMPLL
jgi:hypothetical protein